MGTNYSPKAIKRSISLTGDLWEKIKEKAEENRNGNVSAFIHDAVTAYLSDSIPGISRTPIQGLYDSQRPALKSEISKHLEKLPISESQLLDRLLTSLHIWLEHFDPETDSPEIRIGDDISYTQNLTWAMQMGQKIKDDPELKSLVAEMPSPYKAKTKK